MTKSETQNQKILLENHAETQSGSDLESLLETELENEIESV